MKKWQGYIGGVRISVDFWFLVMLLAVLLTRQELLLWYFLLPVLLHECGHLLAMLICGMGIEGVAFGAFSIAIQRGGSPASPGRELAVALAGVAANLAVAAGFYFFVFPSLRAMLFTAVNLAVALFNLAPIADLDGGQALRLLLEQRASFLLAQRLSRVISFLLLVPLFAAGVFLVLRDPGQFSLLLVCLYLAGRVLFAVG